MRSELLGGCLRAISVVEDPSSVAGRDESAVEPPSLVAAARFEWEDSTFQLSKILPREG